MSYTPSDMGAPVSLGQLARALRRRLVTIGMVTALGAVGGGLYSVGTSAEYAATSVVSLTSIPDNPLAASTSSRTVNTATEIEIVRSSEVADRVVRALKLPYTADEFTARLSVSSPTDSTVVKITYRASTPADAAGGANKTAEVYLAYRGELAANRLDGAMASVNQEIAKLQGQQAKAQSLVEHARSTAEQQAAALALSQVTTSLNDDTQLQARLGVMRLGSGDLVGRATPPPLASASRLVMLVGVGLAIGLVGAVVAALVRDGLDPRLREASDVAALINAPVLGEVWSHESGRGPMTVDQRERYRRIAVLLMNSGYLRRPLSVVPANPENSREIAAWVACAVAEHVHPTMLVSAPSALAANSALVGVASAGGKTEVVVWADHDELVTDRDLHASTMRSGGAVVIDAMNTADGSASLAYAVRAANAVVVARLSHTTADELRSIVGDLRATGVVVAGVVLLSIKSKRRASKSSIRLAEFQTQAPLMRARLASSRAGDPDPDPGSHPPDSDAADAAPADSPPTDSTPAGPAPAGPTPAGSPPTDSRALTSAADVLAADDVAAVAPDQATANAPAAPEDEELAEWIQRMTALAADSRLNRQSAVRGSARRPSSPADTRSLSLQEIQDAAGAGFLDGGGVRNGTDPRLGRE